MNDEATSGTCEQGGPYDPQPSAVPSAPCQRCGYCPNCGRGSGWYPYPYTPYYWTVEPVLTNPQFHLI